MNFVYHTVRNFWTRDKSFTFLLVILAFYLFVLIPFLTESLSSKIAFLVFYYLLLTSSMPFLLKKNKKIIAAFLFLFPLIFLFLEIITSTIWTQVFMDFFIVVYCILLGYIILLRTFQKGRVDARRVQGAIIVYLLAALVFCLLFHCIYLLSITKSFNGLVGSHRKEFLYFSLCTLTTDGYGDIIPLTPFARSLTNLESCIGMLYPAVLISRLVSLEFFYKQTPPQ